MKVPEAGRELDTDVAEKVMGWRPSSRSVTLLGRDGHESYETPGWFDGERWSMVVPSYSTDFSAVEPVLEKLKELRDLIDITWYDGTWEIEAWDPLDYTKTEPVRRSTGTEPRRKVIVEAKTLPHAIALAALKAVEVKE